MLRWYGFKSQAVFAALHPVFYMFTHGFPVEISWKGSIGCISASMHNLRLNRDRCAVIVSVIQGWRGCKCVVADQIHLNNTKDCQLIHPWHPQVEDFSAGFWWEVRLLGGVQQNWAGQCETVGGVGLSCLRHNMQWPTVIANSSWGTLGVVRSQRVQGRALVGVQGAKPLEAPGISHFLVAENGLKYKKILQFTVLQKRPKLHFQCSVSFLSIL